MKQFLFKITLNFYLIFEFIKCFSESKIKFLVDHAQSNGQTGLPQHAEDYHRMPFSSFGLSYPDPSFTIVGQYCGNIGSSYQIFFQIYDTLDPDKKLVMFGYDDQLSKIFVRQQYAANSYSGEIAYADYASMSSNAQTQFTISLKKQGASANIEFILRKGSYEISNYESTINTNMLDWNPDLYTVQFSDGGAPNASRVEYSAYGSVFGVFLIKDIYIKAYGQVAKYFVRRLYLYSQEGIHIINKFNETPEISEIQSKCIPDESISRSVCAKSTKLNKLPIIQNVIATFSKEQDIIIKGLSFYNLFYHYGKFTPSIFFTYSFWLNLDNDQFTSIQVMKWFSNQNKYISINLIKDTNGYKIQVEIYDGSNTQPNLIPQILNYQKFYYLIFSYYQLVSLDMRIIIINDTGDLQEHLFPNILSIIQFTNPETFTFNLQVGYDNNNMNSFFKLSQFQMNLSAAIFYDLQLPIPQFVDQIIQDCQVVILIRLKHQCLVCKVGFYLFNNTCKNTCNSEYTPNQSIRTCVRVCSYRCQTCDSNDPNKCIICSSTDRDISTNCGCKSGYEDQISPECSSKQ